MKKKVCLLIIAVSIALPLKLTAQFSPDYSGNFHTQVAHWNSFYDSVRKVRLARGDSSMKGVGFGKYTEWVYTWKPYVPSSGDMQEAMKIFREMHNRKRYEHLLSIQTDNAPSLALVVPPVNWSEIGPTSYNNILQYGYNPTTSQTEWCNPHHLNTDNFSFYGHVGRFDRIFKHPSQANTLFAYAGNPDNYSGGSLFKTTDGGNSWQVVNGTDKIPNNLITSLEVKPLGSQPLPATEIMFIGHTSGALYRSTDNGATWIEAQYNGTHTFPPNFWAGFPANSIPSHFDMANTLYGGPIQIENYKLQFVSLTSNSNLYARLLVAREGGLYYSDNYDAAITVNNNQITNNIVWSKFSAIDALLTSANVPYAFPSITDKHTLYVTDVEQFQKGALTYLVAHVARKELDSIPNSRDTVRAIKNFIIYSSDDGATWAFLGGNSSTPFFQGDTVFTYISKPQDRSGVQEANIEVRRTGGNYIYVGYYGGLNGYKLHRFPLISALNTNAWQNKSKPTGYQGSILGLPYSFAINPNDDDEYWHCTNTFVHVDNDVIMNEYYDYGTKRHPDVRDVLIIDATTMYIATDGGVYKSTDAGNSFDPKSEGLGGSNAGTVGISQQPPFYVGSGFWHCGFQIYNPVQNKWHQAITTDAAGGKFCFLNNQYYAITHFHADSRIVKDYNVLTQINTFGTPAYASSVAWSENVRGLGYAAWTNNVYRTNDNFHTTTTLTLPVSCSAIGRLYTVPNAKDRLVVYDAAVSKLYFFDNATTSPTYVMDKNVNTVYQALSNSSADARLGEVVFDPNNPDKFYVILLTSAEWNSSATGRIAEYDPTTGQFIDITYLTDDLIYGVPTTNFPIYISIRDIDIDRQTGILYIGTSNGIYYLDPANNIWRKYSANVPFLNSDIELLHCKGEIYSSSTNRGIWKAPLIRTNVPKREWKITANTTWTHRMNLFCTLVIEPGATLTVKDSLIVYGDQKIIIKPGGQMIIDGGFLSTECGDMWEGIQVWGDNTKHQYNNPNTGRPDQGMLVMKNGAVIEYARESAVIFNPSLWGTAGGIIQATNSTFRNNGRSAQFIQYVNFRPNGNPLVSTDVRDNRSFFSNCLFEITGPLPSNQTFHAFVTMWDVRGVGFNGCTFQNIRTDSPPVQDYGKGIYCIDASFRVVPRCNIVTLPPCPAQHTDKNVFKNLWVGVWPVGSSSNTKSYVVDKSIFENCQVGVLSDAMSNMRITENLFDVGGQPGANNTDKQWGVSLQNGTTGFTIEANRFVKDDTTTSDSTGGIWANHTGTSNNTIYRNTFQDLRWGNQATGINKFSTNNLFTPGLKYHCNTNTAVGYDFYVWVPIANPAFGIKPYQGTLLMAPGNIFSNNGTFFEFANQSANLIRYYYTNNNPNEYPNTVTANVIRDTASHLDSCLPTYTEGLSHSASLSQSQYQKVLGDFNNYEDAYSAYRNDLEHRTDGGNTADMVRFIKGVKISDSIPLYDTLRKYTPFLSELVLKNVADRSDALSDQRQYNILLGNPGGLHSDVLRAYLGTKKKPLPQWMIDSLYANRDSVTDETLLTGKVTHYDELRTQALDALVGHTLADSNGVNDSALRSLLKAYRNPQTDYLVVSNYIETGNYVDAVAFLDGIGDSYALKGTVLEEYENFKIYVDFIITILNVKRKTIAQLDNREILQLQAIADASGSYLGSTRARNILNFFYGYQYWNEPGFEDYTSQNVLSGTKPEPGSKEELVKVYPNPTEDNINFGYNLAGTFDNLQLIVFDIQGRQLHLKTLKGQSGLHTLNVENWTSGVYLYRVVGDNKLLQTGKFIVK